MKRIFAANIVGIGAVLALGVAASANAAQAPQGIVHAVSTTTSSPSVSPSVSPSPTATETESPSPTPTDEPTAAVVTADIYFEIEDDQDPRNSLSWEVDGVEVNDEIEMPAMNRFYDDGEFDYCTLPNVDIAADLSSVTVTGADDVCGVQLAFLGITLHGGTFGEVTLGSDTLFSPFNIPQAQGSGGGIGRVSSAVHFALNEVPTLQEFGTDGTNFEANWAGTGLGLQTGATDFAFAVAADGAEPVPGEPEFTG